MIDVDDDLRYTFWDEESDVTVSVMSAAGKQ